MAEEKEQEEEKGAGTVSRRDFLRDAGLAVGGAVVGAAAGAGITYVAAPGKEVVKEVTVTKEVTKEVPVPTTGMLEPASEPEESFVTVAGPSCTPPTVVDVKNGKIVRIRPLHYEETGWTNEELTPAMWKIEARGKTFEPRMQSNPSYLALPYKKRVYSPNRILYPLKRVDWEPGGINVNAQNRGKSKFKRISWDEATDIVASEIKRVHDKYGLYGVFGKADYAHKESKGVHASSGSQTLLLSLIGAKGGQTSSIRNPDSWEGWYWGAMHVWGTGAMGIVRPALNQLKDISENTDMIVWQGGDWETTTQCYGGGYPGQLCRWFGELGIKQIYISPDVNYQNAAHPDKWIPVLPNTDQALQMAIVYTWLTEGTYDEDYVATHVVGMDKVSDYVLGKEDGVPKTPAWASPRCGVPEWTIKALAREWAAKRTSTGHMLGGSFIRGPYSHEPARWECVQLGMQGLGKPGVHQMSMQTYAAPRLSTTLSVSKAVRGQGQIITPQLIGKVVLPHAILNPPTTQWGTTTAAAPVENQFVKYEYPISAAEGGTEIHLIWMDGACHSVCWNDGNMWIQALKSPKIECVIVQQQWLENDCLFADVILPVNTNLEEEDIHTGGAEHPCLMYHGAAVKPVGESKSDYEIVCEIAKKLEKYGGVYADLYNKYTEGKTLEQRIAYAYEVSGAKDAISLEKLKERGYYMAPVAPDWKEDPPGLIGFYKDPKNNPIALPSGKLEFYSERLATNFPDDNERGPYPKYVIGGPGWTHDESLYGEKSKKYPLLIISNHPHWREHAQDDDVPWLREIPTAKVKGYDGYMYEPVWINPVDAAKRGIESGDLVAVYNDRGIELGGAHVTERVIPGAIYMDHASRVDMISCEAAEFTDRGTKWINRGGSLNNITPAMGLSKHCWGLATSGFLVELRKVTAAEMEEWRKKYPEAFARDYDPAYGLKFGAWVEGGMT
jgi:anaerobic selenocysteine-containing dehydrogenase